MEFHTFPSDSLHQFKLNSILFYFLYCGAVLHNRVTRNNIQSASQYCKINPGRVIGKYQDVSSIKIFFNQLTALQIQMHLFFISAVTLVITSNLPFYASNARSPEVTILIR